MAGSDDEFMFMLKKVKEKVLHDAAVIKQNEMDIAHSPNAADILKAKADVIALQTALREKEKILYQAEKRIAALENDAKVDGGRPSMLTQLAEQKAQIVNLNRQAEVHSLSGARISELETALEQARSSAQLSMQASADAAKTIESDSKIASGRLESIKEVGRKYKKKSEDQALELASKDKDLVRARDDLVRQTASAEEFKAALGEVLLFSERSVPLLCLPLRDACVHLALFSTMLLIQSTPATNGAAATDECISCFKAQSFRLSLLPALKRHSGS
jgi:chromosome segregation ATPase